MKNNKLKARIILKYGTQSDFAEAMGVGFSMVSSVVCGRKKVSPEKKTEWAKALGCDPSDIFDSTDTNQNGVGR